MRLAPLSRVVIAVSLVGAPSSPAHAAGPDERSIFFGAAGGFGGALVSHAGLSARFRAGAHVALQVGWVPARRVGIGFEYATWATSIAGTPVHLHALGPRAELSLVSHRAGPFLAASASLSFVEGEIEPHTSLGAGLALLSGHRWAVARWTSLGFEIGAQGNVFGPGCAVVAIAALQLRFHGGAGRR